MENATKALLIAAAVLVAILIISLGLVVYNMAAETVQSVNIDETEIQAHNEKFTRYEGEAKRGNDVNGLLNQALNYNMAQTDDAKKVQISYKGSGAGAATEVLLYTSQKTSAKKVDTGRTYKVVGIRDTVSGLITKIEITQN